MDEAKIDPRTAVALAPIVERVSAELDELGVDHAAVAEPVGNAIAAAYTAGALDAYRDAVAQLHAQLEEQGIKAHFNLGPELTRPQWDDGPGG